MKEFKTACGIIKIKEIIPLNTWQFPIEVNGRIKTIKKVLKKRPSVKGVADIVCKHIAFFDGEFATQQSNEQWLVDILRCENGCTKIVSKKIILEEPFYDVSQNKTMAYGIQAIGSYYVSNNYLRMHGIPVTRRVAGRKGVRKKEHKISI